MSNLEQLVVRTLVCGGNHTGVITRYRLLLHVVFAPCHSPREAVLLGVTKLSISRPWNLRNQRKQ